MKKSYPLLIALVVGCALYSAEAAPFLEVKFHQNSSTSLLNSASGMPATALTLSAPNPTFSANAPFGGGAYAMDFGNAASPGAVDALTGEILNAAKGLKSFTIMGWLNCRSSTVAAGGNRIVSWYQYLNNADGVDLAMTSSGALSLGIKGWNDLGGVASNSGKITVDAGAVYNNWRFFAVTYDGTVTTNNVKFYFGTSTSPAVLDRAVTYNKGTTGDNIAPSLTLGNHSTALRSSSVHAAFRGLMDEMKIYGSKTNADGALSLSAIQTQQGAAPLAGQPGLIYERWNNITGTTLADLTSNSRFPNTPDETQVRTTSEGFKDISTNFGVRLSGYILAPETGTYKFGLTVDDVGELRLSTNANPVNKQTIISITSWQPYDSLSKNSANVNLVAGTLYYIEALMKENSGGDHIRIGWKLPSESAVHIITAPALSTSPPITDATYPSAYNLYEQGTGTRKATMGWEKDGGNSHFYIEAEGNKSLKIQDGNVVVPTRLAFGGKFPDDPNMGDLGFRWDRQEVGDIGHLRLETKNGEHWAMDVESWTDEPALPDVEPFVTFNKRIMLTGPAVDGGWPEPSTGIAQLHFYDGLSFRNVQPLPSGSESERFVDEAGYDGKGISIVSTAEGAGAAITQEYRTQINGGNMEMVARNDALAQDYELSLSANRLSFTDNSDAAANPEVTFISATKIETKEVYADSIIAKEYVVTPKWKVREHVPDYVFEKGYTLKSLPEVESFIKKNKHLPSIPNAEEISNGIGLGDLNMRILKTVEELTLHVIALDKELKVQKLKSLHLEAKLAKAKRNGQ